MLQRHPDHAPNPWFGGIILAAISLTLLCSSAAFAGDAILSWDPTTEPGLAGYRIHYGTAPGSYPTVVDVGLVTTYTVTGLGSGTYYFVVTAYDTAGNESAFSNEASKSFADTTPPVISALAANSLTGTSATITWTTNEPATGIVEYGTTTTYGLQTTENLALVTGHSQGLTGLLASTTYHYRVLSRDAADNLAVSSDRTFTTAAVDTTAPVISGVTSSNVTSSSATVTWATNEASTTQLQYGTTTAYGSTTTLNSALVTGHSQGLTGLVAATTYHFRVLSRDAASNLAASGDFTLTTSVVNDTIPPLISGVLSTNLTQSSATITWSTDEASTTQVQYGTTTAYGSNTALNSILSTAHSQGLIGLQATTTYHYRVLSRDAASNLATSGDFILTTTAATSDTTPPVISAVATSNVSSSGTAVSWSTNEAATTQVQYGTTTAYGSTTTLNSTLGTGHSQGLTGLVAATTYHFRVLSRDAAGNLATSGDSTVTTLAAVSGDNSVLPKTAWTLRSVDSQELVGENGAATNAFDNNSGTFWHTQWLGSNPPPPHEIQIDLGASSTVNGFRYLPRQDGGSNGRIGQYEFYVSTDGTNWGSAVAAGTFANSATRKDVSILPKVGRFVRLRALSEVNGGPWTSMAELDVLGGSLAPVSVLPKTAWTLRSVDSQELVGENGAATNAFDNNSSTFWHTQWLGSNPPPPHEIQIDLGASSTVNGFRYLPRQDGGSNGRIGQYEFYVSTDGTNWGSAVAVGTFANSATLKSVSFPPKVGRFVRLRALSEVNGQPWTSVAELDVLGSLQ